MNENNNPINIYTKLKNIQGETNTQVIKDAYNAFQKYKYMTEYQALTFLRPLLFKQGLSLYFEDLNTDYKVEQYGKEWVVQYWKQATLINCDNSKEEIKSKFLALGSNVNISQAKGSAETYVVKYFLTKFFLIPIADNLDPDKIEKKELTEEEQKKVDELFKKHGLEEDIKTSTANKKISVDNYQPTYRCLICRFSLVYKPENQKYWCAKCNKETAYGKK